RNVETVKPDPVIFPFDESLRQAFLTETQLFVSSMFREDRSLLDLLTADYTFVNERLAEHYGIPRVYGSQFRRVALTDMNRHGLLGQGSILTVTSYPNRTSVVQRGKWILENLLGTPPPPPPPDGTEFQGPAGLSQLLMTKYRDDFVRTATEKLLTYALGRGVEYYDYPTIRSIDRDAARDHYRISSLILAIVKSTPFQMRRASDS